MEKNKNLKDITIKIEGKEWEAALDKAFKKANAKVKIDGFRPGKAPKNIYLKKYGIESLFMDASNYCVDAAYQKMLDENKDLQIAAQPVLNIKSIDEKYIEFVFTLTLKPEILDSISRTIENEIGMTYKEFEKLNFDEKKIY